MLDVFFPIAVRGISVSQDMTALQYTTQNTRFHLPIFMGLHLLSPQSTSLLLLPIQKQLLQAVYSAEKVP